VRAPRRMGAPREGETVKRKCFVGLLMIGALTLVPGGGAMADAGSHASCMGHEASGISPPGSSEEAPRGVRDIKAFINEQFPGPTGATIRVIAQLHEPSHAECDAALE
jgi:hypothetical protein